MLTVFFYKSAWHIGRERWLCPVYSRSWKLPQWETPHVKASLSYAHLALGNFLRFLLKLNFSHVTKTHVTPCSKNSLIFKKKITLDRGWESHDSNCVDAEEQSAGGRGRDRLPVRLSNELPAERRQCFLPRRRNWAALSPAWKFTGVRSVLTADTESLTGSSQSSTDRLKSLNSALLTPTLLFLTCLNSLKLISHLEDP